MIILVEQYSLEARKILQYAGEEQAQRAFYGTADLLDDDDDDAEDGPERADLPVYITVAGALLTYTGAYVRYSADRMHWFEFSVGFRFWRRCALSCPVTNTTITFGLSSMSKISAQASDAF